MKGVHNKDYYAELGVEESASKAEIDRQYKRQAAKHHPDLGGNEERMKSLNEAYSVLKNHTARRDYDRSRQYAVSDEVFIPVTQPTARDLGVFGYCLSALLCSIAGLFLLLLVRFQWMWFLWPLVILAVFVLGCGVLMARSAMRALANSLPTTNRLKRHTGLHELAFWSVILTGIYGLYLLLE
ncbi:MAG TPA: J domain-containing protein [Pyrinomonadaceae bacterium]